MIRLAGTRWVPQNPELSVETENVDVDNCAHQVLLKLESRGLIKA
ncbi:hypothetical protein ACFMBG_10765 [Leisingera sp. D0M16]